MYLIISAFQCLCVYAYELTRILTFDVSSYRPNI